MKKYTAPVIIMIAWTIICALYSRHAFVQPTTPPATNASAQAAPFVAARQTKIDARLFALRVQEYRGAMFEAMALDYMRGKPVDLDLQKKVARQAAQQVAKGADEWTRDAMLQGAEEFCRAIEEARKK